MPTATSSGGWNTPLRCGIGAQLLDGPQAQYAIATALGGDRANIGRHLTALESEGRIARACDDADAQRRWALADGQREQLLAAIAAGQPTGSLVAGQRIVSVAVPADRQAAIARRLRAARDTGQVVWVAKVEGARAQWLLIISADAQPHESQRLVALLEAQGARCGRLIVEEVMNGEAFRRQLSSLRQAAASER
jgi:hypothetical protein